MEVVDRPKYVILTVRNRRVLYKGENLTTAATLFNPGTVCGKGRTMELAMAEAERLAEEARRAV